jgi:hypothetical protein
MPHEREKGAISGTVIVRSHPAGTIDRYNALKAEGRIEEAQALVKSGRVELRQKNMIVWSLGYGFDILVQFLISVYTAGFSINNATTLSGTTDGTTAVITGLSSTSGIAPGMAISGAGIPPYSTVVSIDSGTSITISQATTAAGTVPLYFAQHNQLGIGWGEIGTGSTSPMNTDTALTTPTNRAPVSYAADVGFSEAQLQFFFPDGVLANQTYYEFGTFVGGGSALGSGNLFNHALFTVPYSKTAGTDTTCEVDFEFGAGSSGFDEGGFT